MFKLSRYFFVIFFILFSSSFAQDRIVFIDIDAVINQSIIGKKLNKNLNDNFKKEDAKISELEKKLKDRENEILKQKNILSEEELNKKFQNLRKDINDFNKKKINISEKFRKEKLEQTNKLVGKLNLILSKFAEQNSISMIVQKQNIVMGKSDLDITKEIINIFNKEVKSIN